MVHTVCTIVIFQFVFHLSWANIIKELKPEWLPMFFGLASTLKFAILFGVGFLLLLFKLSPNLETSEDSKA